MYRCGLCSQPSKAGEPRRVHIVYREEPRKGGLPPRRQIQEEIPVCGDCFIALQYGAKLEDIRREAREHALAIAAAPPSPTKSMVRTVEVAGPPREVAILGVPVRTGGRTVARSEKGSSVKSSGQSNGAAPKKKVNIVKCDVCGGPIGEGQMMAESMVCERCGKKAREGAREARVIEPQTTVPPQTHTPPQTTVPLSPRKPDPRVKRRGNRGAQPPKL